MPQGAALGAMVGKMTYGKRQWERYDDQMRQLIPIMHHTMDELLPMVDADTGAFNDYMVITPVAVHFWQGIAGAPFCKLRALEKTGYRGRSSRLLSLELLQRCTQLVNGALWWLIKTCAAIADVSMLCVPLLQAAHKLPKNTPEEEEV